MEAVRKAYQRAVQIPMDQVKRLWEEYQEFENNLNKITVCAFLLSADLSADNGETGQEAHLRPDTESYASTHGVDYAARTSDCAHPTGSCHERQHLASASAQFLRWRQGPSW